MILKVFAVFDKKVGVYLTPFFVSHAISAQRMFAEARLDDNSQISKFPGDFDLYELGEFDTKSGMFSSESAPRFVISAVDLME